MDTSSACGTGPAIIMGIIWLAVVIFLIASLWKVFTKAGQPGWGSLIPIYNTYLMLKIAGKPGWWLILFFIPLVNLIIGIIMMLGIAENFGKGAGFAVGLILIPLSSSRSWASATRNTSARTQPAARFSRILRHRSRNNAITVLS